MREIKFRAWCEGTHESLTSGTPHMDYDITLVNGVYASVEAGWDIHGTYPTVPIMQYTGLKDKNGVVIWEGDICKYNNEIGVVKFDYGAFDLYKKNDDDDNSVTLYYAEMRDSTDWEVIGNIYENPGLLTTQ